MHRRWVGARSGELKATAATLYLLAYYAGVTFGGWIGGYFWIHLGWGGVVLMCSLAVAGALGVALRIGAASMRPPSPEVPPVSPGPPAPGS